MHQKNNGFIYVASKNKAFLSAAVYSAASLKDYWPEANITLFTHEEWSNSLPDDLFDNVVFGAPDHIRAKLWALDKTPYDLTVYMDADTEVMSEEISAIFDQIPDDKDILITKIRPYNGKIAIFPGGQLTDHCGFFMYRNSEKVLTFMTEWWKLYQKQESGEWQWDIELYPEQLRPWDQWSYWWLQNKTDLAVDVGYFEDDARWNFVNGYLEDETDKEIIIYHHTVPQYYEPN